MTNDRRPLSWFTERVGKRVVRLHENGHACAECVGFVIRDAEHAELLYTAQEEFGSRYSAVSEED